MKITKSQLKEIITEELNEVYFEESEEEIIAETDLTLLTSLGPETIEALKIIATAGSHSLEQLLEPATLVALGLGAATGIRKGLGYNDTDPE